MRTPSSALLLAVLALAANGLSTRFVAAQHVHPTPSAENRDHRVVEGLAESRDRRVAEILAADEVAALRPDSLSRIGHRRAQSIRICMSMGPSTSAPPLVVLDGAAMDHDAFNLRTLLPEQIATIEVIKGPAAADLYGPRASSGAIVITTRPPARAPTPPR